MKKNMQQCKRMMCSGKEIRTHRNKSTHSSNKQITNNKTLRKIAMISLPGSLQT